MYYIQLTTKRKIKGIKSYNQILPISNVVLN